MAEYEMNLENLIKMKRVFEEADEDGSGELDPDAFYEKLGPHLGQSLTRTQVAQLFMRIDAECGGTIDWEEFIDYFFLQRAATGASEGVANWRLHAQATITGGRGGQLRVWAAGDLVPLQTITNGGGWVTDCAYVEGPTWKKLVVAAQDRTLTFYDPVRSSLEYSGRLSCPGSMGPPLCLAELEREAAGAAPRLVWGDTEGMVMLLRAEPPPARTERQMVTRRDFEVLHAGHTDWVTRVQHIPDVGLVSSSLDASLAILDLERRKVAATVSLHKKGVHTFGYSPAFSLVASGGVERSVLLWQPKGNVNRKVGELAGHSAGVRQLVVADEQCQVITLSDDHMVRVWDLRNHKCVQAIGKADWARPEDCHPTAMAYDTSRRRLVCASHKPAAWAHRPVEVERSHDSRLVAALYDSTFSVVVSGDEGGTVVLWNLHDGRREGGFSLHSHPTSAAATGRGAGRGAAAQPKLTAMGFDAAQRRLLTATYGGAVKLWNFNSGAVLREFCHREGPKEVTAVAFVAAAEAATGEAEAGDEEVEEADEHEGTGQAGTACSAPAPAAPAGDAFADSSSCSELSEHAVLTVQQQQRASQVQAAGAEASAAAASDAGGSDADAGANRVLAVGWSRAVCVWEEGAARCTSQYRRLGGHAADILCLAPLGTGIAATGDFEGQVRVWHLPSGACLASFSCGGAQFERAVHKLCWLLAANAEGGAWAGTGTGAAAAPLLVACSEDRGVQFWRVELPPASGSAAGEAAAGPQRGAADTEEQQAPAAACTLVARISVAHRPQDCITAMCPGNAGGSAQQLWTGDSGGHVALWDVSNLTQASTSAAASPAGSTAALGGGLALPQRLLMWRAADAPVVSLDPLAPGHGLLLVGGQDAHMGVWTQRGGLVGRFGQHSWDLDAPATWQDPGALSPPLPLPIDAGGSGLTPQEVISNHRRSSWAARSGSASSAQVSARREGRQPAVGQPAWGEAALEPLAATLASISRLPQTVADDGAANVGATAFQQGTAQPPAVPAASASAHQQLLSPESAGARLSALAAEKVAARASRWEVPVHVQAHSALALQRMDAVPAGTADMQVKEAGKVAGAGERERIARASSPAPPGRRCSSMGPGGSTTIAVILGRSATAFGRRTTQPHQHGDG